MVPSSILTQLQDNYEKNTKKNLWLSFQLWQIVQAFSKEDITVLVFKGPVLSAQAYDDISLRFFNDLDLLVHKKAYYKAKGVLNKLGYILNPDQTNSQEKLMLRFSISNTFIHPEHNVQVELHWDLFSNYYYFPVPLKQFWQDVQDVSVNRFKFPSFSNEKLLLFLCFHGSKHYWSRLEWVCSIHNFIENNKIEWEQLERSVKKYNSKKLLYLGLLLAHELFETTLPERIKKAIGAVKSAADKVSASWRNRSFAEKRPALSSWDYFYFNWKLRDGWIHKSRYIISWMFLPTILDREFIKLPFRLSFLYFFVHPIRILVRLIPSGRYRNL